jgi:hypothetical protein
MRDTDVQLDLSTGLVETISKTFNLPPAFRPFQTGSQSWRDELNILGRLAAPPGAAGCGRPAIPRRKQGYAFTKTRGYAWFKNFMLAT